MATDRLDDDPILAAILRAKGDEDAALDLFEAIRWPNAPWCPYCRGPNVYKMTGRDGKREAHRRWRCRACDRMYTVRTDGIFQSSRIPLKIWAHALHAVIAHKKGYAALQLKRETLVSYPTALFVLHRIRFALESDWSGTPRLSGVVEADETYIGGKPRSHMKGRTTDNPNVRARGAKPIVHALVERGGNVRIQRITGAGGRILEKAIREVVHPDAKIMTDDWAGYRFLDKKWKGGHGTTCHSRGEYAKPDGTHSNTAESVFALIKRGIMGTWHSVSKHRLPLYLNEFEFRWNTRSISDSERFVQAALKGEGKRLRYRLPASA